MMAKKYIIFILIASISKLLIGQTNDTLFLDINKAIEIALNESPTVKISDLDITKTNYAKKGAFGQLLPQIDLFGQYQRTIKKQTMYMDKSAMAFPGMPADTSSSVDDEPIAIQFGRWNMWTGGVNVSLPLVVPSLWKSLDLNEMDIALALEESRSTKINLINSIKKSFYSLLFAQESLNVLKQTYYYDSINYNNIKTRYKHGVDSEYNMISAQVQMQNNLPNILQAKNMIRLAELQLKIFLGINDEMNIKATGSLQSYKEIVDNSKTSLEVNLDQNSELKKFDIQNQKLATSLEIQKLQKMPSLVTSFGYNFISQNDDFKFKNYKWSPYSNVGLTLSIPIFNGFQRNYNIKQTNISLQQLELQRIDIAKNLRLGIKNNLDIMATNLEQIETTKSTIAMAEKGYQIALKMFENGLATISELNAASLALTNIKLKYQNILFDYLKASADLEKILGNNN